MKNVQLNVGFIICLISGLLTTVSSDILAESNQHLLGSLMLSTEYSDNTFTLPGDGTEERRDEISAAVTGMGSNKNFRYQLNYLALKKIFNRESQPDRSLLQGQSSFFLGDESSLFNLDVSHSRVRTKIDLHGLDNLDNTDEKSISSVNPAINLSLSSVDSLSLKALYSNISHRYISIKDSERSGGSLIFNHRFSKTDALNMTLKHERAEISTDPYDEQQVTLTYSSKLRRASYKLELGYSQINPDVGVESESPLINFQWDYIESDESFSISALHKITDTSQGNSNQNLSDGLSLGDSVGSSLGRYKITDIQLSWGKSGVCDRCELELQAGFNGKSYGSNSLLDSNQYYTNSELSKSFSRNLRLSAGFEIRQYKFDREALDYALRQTTVESKYQINKTLSLSLYGEHTRRNGYNPLKVYSENVAGLKLDYTFY